MKFFKTSELAVELVSDTARPLAKHSVLKSFTVSIAASVLLLSSSAFAVTKDLEKEDLKFGFIKLTDMAPLAIAYEKGYFEDEGLYVTLEAQANWKVFIRSNH